jgi:hypothetical protein
MVPGAPAGSSSNAVRPQANPAKDNVRPISIQRHLRIMPAIVSAERFVYLAFHRAQRLARDEAHLIWLRDMIRPMMVFFSHARR